MQYTTDYSPNTDIQQFKTSISFSAQVLGTFNRFSSLSVVGVIKIQNIAHDIWPQTGKMYACSQTSKFI